MYLIFSHDSKELTVHRQLCEMDVSVFENIWNDFPRSKINVSTRFI